MGHALRIDDLPTWPLDRWYRVINRIYLDRNFYRDSFSIFGHLVEVVGGLSVVAAGKVKPGVEPQIYTAKAVAWWLALCGRVGVASVSDLLWQKFPGVCPYCERRPHSQRECRQRKKEGDRPRWRALAALGQTNIAQRPATLTQWQQMYADIYPPQQTEGYASVFARLAEELGELAEALRAFPVAPGYFLSEAADVFAWLMHLKNVLDNTDDGNEADLGSLLAESYPDACKDCGSYVCVCPAVLAGTLGRIAHEIPPEVGYFKQGGNLLSLPDAVELFQATRAVRMGGRTISMDENQVDALFATLAHLRKDMSTSAEVQDARLTRALDELMQRTNATDRDLQVALNTLQGAIQSLTPEKRDRLIEILGALNVNVWSATLLQVAAAAVR